MAKEDLSNYWYPKLYFRDPKTEKLEAVPDGGLTVYYLFRGVDDKKNGGPGLKAFPNGLKMLTGDLTQVISPQITDCPGYLMKCDTLGAEPVNINGVTGPLRRHSQKKLWSGSAVVPTLVPRIPPAGSQVSSVHKD